MAIKVIKKTVNTDLQSELKEIYEFIGNQKNIADYMQKSLEKYKGLNAIIDDHNNIKMTYDEVLAHITSFASSLQKLGISPKDFVSIFSENNGLHFICNQGIIKTGACSVLRGSCAPIKELEYILNHSESKALILSDYKILNSLKNIINSNKNLKFIVIIFPKNEKPSDLNIPVYTFDEFIEIGKNNNFIKPEINPDDNLTMLYTSGTTGNPKGVLLSHKNMLSQILPIEYGLKITVGERSLQILPVWHAYEMTTQIIFFANGFHLHFTTIPYLKDDLLKYDIDIFMSVPRIWEAIRLGIYQKLKQKSK
ncbi:MAG TPA: AMP-binding protein, partial [Candidatus Gastranaerophilaceae bacterium]|nr:AMP-binding protein [Candidatus Gastranaerophilaceae bacterium]